MPSKLPRLLTVAETAQHTRVSEKTIRRRMQDGQLRFHRVGRRQVIREEDVLAMLNRVSL
jgi:excisionase family DNA binding protein